MMDRPRIPVILTAALALASVSCINDRPDDPDRKDKEAVLSFNPIAGDHGKTRGATYDDTWTEFADFFGGTATQQEDIFNAPDPNPLGRPDGWGRAADRRIATFRVLVYHATTDATLGFEAGDLVRNRGQYMNRVFEWTEDMNDPDRKPPFELSVPRGTYDFVFVANENGLSSVLAVDPDNGSVDPRIATLAEFKKLTFAHDTEIATDSGTIPMTGWYPGVEVTPDEITYTEDGTSKTAATGHEGNWAVLMTRAAIRLSFGIHLGAAEYAAWRTYHAGDADPLLYIEGLRGAGYVYPHPAADRNNGTSTFDMPAAEAIAASATQSGTGVRPGKTRVNADGSADLFFDRLIYPEHQPARADRNSASKGVRAYMRFDYGSRVVTKEFPVHAVDGDGALTDLGYSIPRNTWVWARARVLTDVEHTVRIVPWGGGALLTPIDQWTLTTDRSEFLFRTAASSGRMTLASNHPEGWDAAVQLDGAGWLTINSGTTLHGATGVPTVVTVGATANTGGNIRTGTIVVTAGKLVRSITVLQLPGAGTIVDTPNPPAAMFVGAFWRADQYGERLFRVRRPTSGTMDGPWAAYVIEGADWIVLDTTPSSDSGVGGNAAQTNLTKADFDTAYRVAGYATSVSGTVGAAAGQGDIYFRAGLNGPWPKTRYGLILLVYTKQGVTAFQRIWVRQGEQADYLMRPGDGNARTQARRFSPYNLTAREFTSRGAAGAAGSTTPVVQIHPQDDRVNYTGAFTDYPSQAGAIFPWAHSSGVKAYNPTGSVSSTDWLNSIVHDAWDEVWYLHENCPPGYHRPSDGNTSSIDQNMVDNVVIEESEMFQSLFVNANGGGHLMGGNTDNSVWGLYADGWFDRKHNGSTSAGGNSAVAYQGRLFYNPAGLNSLFFPAAGSRHAGNGGGTGGALQDAGAAGMYWSSSASYVAPGAHHNSWALMVSNASGAQSAMQANRFGTGTRDNGFSIRCVADTAPVAALSVAPATLTFPGGGGTRNVEVESSSDNGFAARWIVTGFSIDNGATFLPPDQCPAWLTMPTTGIGALPGRVQTVAISVESNPGADRRVVVRIAQVGRPYPEETITITQEQ